jgi:hypothetical protein
MMCARYYPKMAPINTIASQQLQIIVAHTF